MGIKIANNLSLPKYLLRSLILYNIWINVLKLILIFLVSKNHYIVANNILYIVALVIEVTIIIMVTMRSDNRGLHDLIIGSSVVSTKEKKVEG